MTKADQVQAKALHKAYRTGGRPFEEALGVAVTAAMMAVIPGSQKKRQPIVKALRLAGYNAARKQLRRNPAGRQGT